MTTRHAQTNFYAGDDWQIDATLLDETGAPFDLTGATISWVLMNVHTHAQLVSPLDAVITVVDALAGTCTITVPRDKTSPVPTGLHEDALRIIDASGIASTLSTGPVHVQADPFMVPALLPV